MRDLLAELPKRLREARPLAELLLGLPGRFAWLAGLLRALLG